MSRLDSGNIFVGLGTYILFSHYFLLLFIKLLCGSHIVSLFDFLVKEQQKLLTKVLIENRPRIDTSVSDVFFQPYFHRMPAISCILKRPVNSATFTGRSIAYRPKMTTNRSFLMVGCWFKVIFRLEHGKLTYKS